MDEEGDCQIGPQTRAPKWQNTSDQRLVFLASTCCPTVLPLSLEPPCSSAPLTSRHFILVSVSLSFIWRMKVKWNYEMSNETLSLSLFKTLSDSIFLTMIVCCFCLTLFITLLIFASVFDFIRWCWYWWDTINCLFVLV